MIQLPIPSDYQVCSFCFETKLNKDMRTYVCCKQCHDTTPTTKKEKTTMKKITNIDLFTLAKLAGRLEAQQDQAKTVLIADILGLYDQIVTAKDLLHNVMESCPMRLDIKLTKSNGNLFEQTETFDAKSDDQMVGNDTFEETLDSISSVRLKTYLSGLETLANNINQWVQAYEE